MPSSRLPLFLLFLAFFLNSLFGVLVFPIIEHVYHKEHACDESRIITTMIYKDSLGAFSGGGFVRNETGYKGRKRQCYRTYRDYKALQSEIAALGEIPYAQTLSPYISTPGLDTLLLYPFWRASQQVFSTSRYRYYFGLWTLRTVCALSTSLVLILLCLWIKRETTLFSALLVGVALMVSSPLLLYVMGRSAMYKPLMFFLPFLLVAFSMQSALRKNTATRLFLPLLSLAAGGTIFLKVLFGWGYDLLAPVMVSVTIPVFWYAMREKWSPWQFLLWFSAISFGAILGFLLAIFVHALQTQAIGVDFLEYAKNRFLWRQGGYNASGGVLDCSDPQVLLSDSIHKIGCQSRLSILSIGFLYNLPSVVVVAVVLWAGRYREEMRTRLKDAEQRRLWYAILVCLGIGILGSASQPLTLAQATRFHYWWEDSCWVLMFRPFLFMLLAYVCEPSLSRWVARASARWAQKTRGA